MSSYGRLDWDVPSINHIPDIKYIDHAKVVDEVANWLNDWLKDYEIIRDKSKFTINGKDFYIYGFAKRFENQAPIFNQTDNKPLIFAVRSEEKPDNYTFEDNKHYYKLYYCKDGIEKADIINLTDIKSNSNIIEEGKIEEIIKNG